MRRPAVLILFGGRSEEREVSVKSAVNVLLHWDEQKYEAIPVFIAPDGAWRRYTGSLADLARGALRDPRWLIPAALAWSGGARVLWQGAPGGAEPVPLDAAFPLLHGKQGEDGAVQGLLEMSGLAYVGCGVRASTLAMDKALAHEAARQAGVPVPRGAVLGPEQAAEAAGARFPAFVKPAASGSSFGVSRVERAEDLPRAVAAARAYGEQVIVEEAIEGSEVGCALLEEEGSLRAGAVDQIVLKNGFFRIHQEARPEQGSENAQVRVPADAPEEVRARVVAAAKAIYRAIGCRDLARVDLFLTPDGRIVFNEINTMPGLTTYSRYPRMMRSAGLGMDELTHRLVERALARAQ